MQLLHLIELQYTCLILIALVDTPLWGFEFPYKLIGFKCQSVILIYKNRHIDQLLVKICCIYFTFYLVHNLYFLPTQYLALSRT